ncbi:Itaconate transport protein [Colletotrichum tropicale]|nr:Itaconate transport protein [Colletotrichum tropicale]
MGCEVPVELARQHTEDSNIIFNRLSRRRKHCIVTLLSFCALLSSIATTSVLAASPEVASQYDTTVSMINNSNAMYTLSMALSPLFWGPMSQLFGRRWVTTATTCTFLGFSIGTALAPNLTSFFIFRMLSGFQGTSFILVGSAVIGDIYHPTERATALGWFLSGTQIGPALGPCMSGIIVTYTSWRVSFWSQTAMSAMSTLGAFIWVPETIHRKGITDSAGISRMAMLKFICHRLNPWRVVQLYAYPNIVLTGLASSSLLWNLYSIFSSIRIVLNPRFRLTTPLQSGLFFLAPGAGYLLGTFLGGRYADLVVKRYIKKRGKRIPEDRLISAVPFIAFNAACILVYGWTIESDSGGIPVAVIVLFLQGVGQLMCFPSLNTYCIDVLPKRSGEVVAANFLMRYLFSCIATATVVPGINAIGIGWISTVNAAFLIISCIAILGTVTWGARWRDRIRVE